MNSHYLAILGRQPKLGLAELERRFGSESVTLIQDEVALLVTNEPVNISVLGGSIKIARLIEKTTGNAWLGVSKKVVTWLERELSRESAKVTLGFSAYGFSVSERDVQKTGLIIKRKLKDHGGSIRLVPNTTPALSSAQVFHNKLASGDTKREIIITSGHDGHGYIGETTQVQDIDAYTLRDRLRPRRDPLTGMLPPKLAQMMINLAASDGRLLDPFCGTGVVLMEAALMGHGVYGTDVNEKMIRFSRDNLQWLQEKYNRHIDFYLHEANATDATWQQPIHTVVSETYLGEPMAQTPTPEKLEKVMEKCENIVRGFLENLAPQLSTGTTLCIAVPAWRIAGEVRHLKTVDDLDNLGYNWIDFKNVTREDLLYYREDQVVARELLVIKKG